MVSQNRQFWLVRAKLEPGLKISKLESDLIFLRIGPRTGFLCGTRTEIHVFEKPMWLEPGLTGV
jgi:hypothetical protein